PFRTRRHSEFAHGKTNGSARVRDPRIFNLCASAPWLLLVRLRALAFVYAPPRRRIASRSNGQGRANRALRRRLAQIGGGAHAIYLHIFAWRGVAPPF